MSSWAGIQETLVKKHDSIAEIEVETITYTRLGGYNARPYSTELKLYSELTAKSLKGVWRWWARTAIIAALGGNADYIAAKKFLGKIFGGTDKDEGVSRYWLEVKNFELPANFEKKIGEIVKKVETFYKDAEDFLNTYPPQKLGLQQDTKIEISLYPGRPELSISISRNVNWNFSIIKNTPIGKYIKRDPTKRNRNRELIFPLKVDVFDRISNIPRFRLLLMKRKDEADKLTNKSLTKAEKEKIIRYLNRMKEELVVSESVGIKFKILVYGSPNDVETDFAISTLLLSLILGGVGSMARRGFGSLKINSIDMRINLRNENLKDIIKDLLSNKFGRESLEEALRELCSVAVESGKKLVEQMGHKPQYSSKEKDIPKVPSLNEIKIKVVNCSNPDLASIGNAFMKQRWKDNPRKSGRDIHTWILGLPRFQNKTGYAVKKDEKSVEYEIGRRISSIGARVFQSVDNKFIILYGFLSGDWPLNQLVHIKRNGANREENVINILKRNKSSIKDVYETAFRKVEEWVCRK